MALKRCDDCKGSGRDGKPVCTACSGSGQQGNRLEAAGEKQPKGKKG